MSKYICAFDVARDIKDVVIKSYEDIEEHEIENLAKGEGIFYFEDNFFYDYVYDKKNKTLTLALVKTDKNLENKKELLLNLKDGKYIYQVSDLLYFLIEVKNSKVELFASDRKIEGYKEISDSDLEDKSKAYRFFSLERFKKIKSVLFESSLLILAISTLINAISFYKVNTLKLEEGKKVIKIQNESDKLKALLNFLNTHKDIKLKKIEKVGKNIVVIYSEGGYEKKKIF